MRFEQRFFSYITLLLLFTGIGYTFWPEFFVKKNYDKYIAKPISQISWFKKDSKKASKDCDCRPSSSDTFKKFESFSITKEIKNFKSKTKHNLENRLSHTRKKVQSLKKLMKINK